MDGAPGNEGLEGVVIGAGVARGRERVDDGGDREDGRLDRLVGASLEAALRARGIRASRLGGEADDAGSPGGAGKAGGAPGSEVREVLPETARKQGHAPERTALLAASPSAVRAGLEGGIGVVAGVADAPGRRLELRKAGAHLAISPEELDEDLPDRLDRWIRARDHRRPSLFGSWEAFREELEGRRPVFFLDYDGTLAPIAPRPDDAHLPPSTRRALAALARRFPVTIVSGRGLADVAEFVGLDDVSYAGSHGFEIVASGEEGGEIRHEAAAHVEPEIEEVSRELETILEAVEGAIVEPKRFSVAVHYRGVGEGDVGRVEEAVDRVLTERPKLRRGEGKKVFEIRPDLDWDKGRAVLWLLEALELDGEANLPIYVGDDVTDEDAFRALEGRGVGILVTDAPRPTAARYQLQDPDEVRAFLGRMGER